MKNSICALLVALVSVVGCCDIPDELPFHTGDAIYYVDSNNFIRKCGTGECVYYVDSNNFIRKCGTGECV
ncbi:MAG: hypothetical protein NC115_05910, partial [Bacteroidales bacterium]|nr:hypothetical protein [Bacteroidales bacterium]